MLTSPLPARSRTADEACDLVRYLGLFDLDLGECESRAGEHVHCGPGCG